MLRFARGNPMTVMLSSQSGRWLLATLRLPRMLFPCLEDLQNRIFAQN